MYIHVCCANSLLDSPKTHIHKLNQVPYLALDEAHTSYQAHVHVHVHIHVHIPTCTCTYIHILKSVSHLIYTLLCYRKFINKDFLLSQYVHENLQLHIHCTYIHVRTLYIHVYVHVHVHNIVVQCTCTFNPQMYMQCAYMYIIRTCMSSVYQCGGFSLSL